jgi:hypothetical protein
MRRLLQETVTLMIAPDARGGKRQHHAAGAPPACDNWDGRNPKTRQIAASFRDS